MERKEVVELTNMCMICNGEKVLVQNRVKSWKGITFPGGHIERGESFTDAVIREVFEETGLTISNPQLCGIKDWQQEDGSRYMVLLYKTNRFQGELHSSSEGEVFWTDLKTLPQLSLAGDMKEVLNVFLNDDISEFFYFMEDNKWKSVLK